jgi:hypothetical protein
MLIPRKAKEKTGAEGVRRVACPATCHPSTRVVFVPPSPFCKNTLETFRYPGLSSPKYRSKIQKEIDYKRDKLNCIRGKNELGRGRVRFRVTEHRSPWVALVSSSSSPHPPPQLAFWEVTFESLSELGYFSQKLRCYHENDQRQ